MLVVADTLLNYDLNETFPVRDSVQINYRDMWDNAAQFERVAAVLRKLSNKTTLAHLFGCMNFRLIMHILNTPL